MKYKILKGRDFMKMGKRIVAFAAALMLTTMCCLSTNSGVKVQALDTNNDDWLHCKGNKIYDMYGNEVWLTGANWFGFNQRERFSWFVV